MRRLPVYLLLDVSGSMAGEAIEAVRTGMDNLRDALRRDPYALESAYVSVITFSTNAEQVVPLTEVPSFVPPPIEAGGGTSLGGALHMVTDCARTEVHKTNKDKKGDWRPLVFIMTDGVPTDNIMIGLEEFQSYKWGDVIACAAGPDADDSVLLKITENVIRLEITGSRELAAYFKWVSSLILTGSRSSSAVMPPPPPEITLVQP